MKIKTKILLHILLTIGCICICIGFYYCTGAEFKRGFDLAMLYGFTIIIIGLANMFLYMGINK